MHPETDTEIRKTAAQEEAERIGRAIRARARALEDDMPQDSALRAIARAYIDQLYRLALDIEGGTL